MSSDWKKLMDLDKDNLEDGIEKFKDHAWLPWALIIFLFFVGLAPIALILLVIKLSRKDEKKKKVSGASGRGQAAAKPAKTTAVERAMKAPAARKSTARWLKIGGVFLALVGIFACVEPIDMMIWLGEIESYYVEDLLVALAMAVGGGVMLWNGAAMERGLKRYAKYLSVMGDREAIPVKELARTLGYSERRVEKDLQKMIDKGYFGGRAYLNVELGYLFRSGEADAALKKQRQEAAQKAAERTAQATEEGYALILRNIRLANDRIEDEALSAKIDRLEAITAKIFQAVETDPKKRGRIDTFLNYYLPTTQKLLDSYAEFESAGIEGENLRQAKQRIETTMDNIIGGFEHQLDQLYKADALDVDSDIRVMETMLRRDTASVEKDFGMGAAAAKKEE